MSEQKDKDQQKRNSEIEQQVGAACCSQPKESNRDEEESRKDKTFEEIADDWVALLMDQMNQSGREVGSILGKHQLDKEKAVDILDSILATRENIDEATIVESIVKVFRDERERVLKDNTPEGKKILREYEEKLKVVANHYKALTKNKNRKLDEKLHETRLQEHLFFLTRVFDFFYGYYGMKLLKPVNDEKKIFMLFVARAVLGISSIYRDKWREIFYSIKKRMFLKENFMEYCCMVPDEKFGPYFYNVLQRIAVIFEMALFCFEHDYDMFEIALNSAVYFLDVDFFADAGDWPIFQRAAEIVDNLTVPLRCALSCEKSNLNSFSDVIEELVETHVIAEDSRIYLLLKELNKAFECKSKKVFGLQGASRKKRDSPKRQSTMKDSSADSRNRDGREILVSYFKDCLPDYFSKNSDSAESTNWGTGQEYILDLEYWIHDATTNTSKQEIDEVQKILSDLNLDVESQTAGTRVRSPHKAGTSGLQTESPKADTGAKPKRKQKMKRKALPYVNDQTDYVEDLIELYKNTLPSFLKTYLHKLFIPQMEDESLFNTKDSCFIMQTDLMMERKKILKQKTRKQKRLWAESPLGFPCAVPLEVERILDMYIMNDNYTTINIGLGRSLSFIGPDDATRPWNIRCTLDEAINPFTTGEKAMKKYKNLLRSISDPHSCIIEDDLETVQNLRILEETLNAVLPTSVPTESESQSESPRRRKHKKKKSKK